MKLLTQALREMPEFQGLLAAVDGGGCPAAVSGLSPVHRAYLAAGLRQETGRSIVLVCADEEEAGRMAWDLQALTGEELETANEKWWAYWQEYWKRRESSSPLPRDYGCQGTIPAGRHRLGKERNKK